MGLFTLLFFMWAYVWGQPYRNAFPNTLQTYIQLTLFITLYCEFITLNPKRPQQPVGYDLLTSRDANTWLCCSRWVDGG